MTTSTYLRQHVIPAAYALLPEPMASTPATALLLTIALQESRCAARCQFGGGPARSMWQFEPKGLAGILAHPASTKPLQAALFTLRYVPTVTELYAAIEHNDVLAAVCARVLLWTDPKALPARDEPQAGWQLYLRTWRPGRQHPLTWDGYYIAGWTLAEA